MSRDESRFRKAVVLVLVLMLIVLMFAVNIGNDAATSRKGTSQGGSRGTTGGIAVLAALGGGALQ
jgi:hypothetical protein